MNQDLVPSGPYPAQIRDDNRELETNSNKSTQVVAVAPPASVITTLLFEKSIPDSFIISSPASTEALSVPFKTILS